MTNVEDNYGARIIFATKRNVDAPLLEFAHFDFPTGILLNPREPRTVSEHGGRVPEYEYIRSASFEADDAFAVMLGVMPATAPIFVLALAAGEYGLFEGKTWDTATKLTEGINTFQTDLHELAAVRITQVNRIIHWEQN